MLKPMIMDWINKHKNKYWFKYVIILTVLIVLAFAANQYSKYKAKPEAPVTEAAEEISANSAEEQEEKQDFLADFLKNNKLHLIGISGIAVGLAVIDHKKKHSIKESR